MMAEMEKEQELGSTSIVEGPVTVVPWDIFNSIQKDFENEQEMKENLRAKVKDLEQTTRQILFKLQRIHQCPRDKVAELCAEIEPSFSVAKQHSSAISALVPCNAYYKYSDHWRFSFQRMSFLCAFHYFLKSGELATHQDVANTMGVCSKQEDGFHLEVEDYLQGLLTVANEMSRLAVNSVTLGDFARPFEISEFLSNLNSGFRLLNLKNDSLRKKFDSLKYEVKKVEEVVYDISIRGLHKPTKS